MNGDEYYVVSPGGAHLVKVEIGVDSILRMQHQMRQSTERVLLPQAQIAIVKRSTPDAVGPFLHDTFFHRSDENIYQTLGVTKGYKYVRIHTEQCDACAKAKAQSFGLSQQRHRVMPNCEISDPVFDDDNGIGSV